ncbi:hypothetical protein SteCoe_36920 [Stentor coeruleus]|uniref:Lysosomal dipeptide transporter MFSD1 n=1 Tax=Stentor coeruleus TaxID=5963 RepID=A0A1R2AP72_9CILI|nr:hypothetical protein SteCoe_36920 [Stentor coeruleus]
MDTKDVDQHSSIENCNSVKPPLDIRKTRTRFCMLALVSVFCFGMYYTHDNPAPLELQLIDELNIDNLRFNLLFSAFSFPNIFMPIIFGYLIDRFCVRKIIYTVSTIALIGQGIFALAISLKNYPTAVIGRALFGIGAESLELAQTIILVNWFTGKELSMSIGLGNSISFLGIMMNQNLQPIIADHTSVSFAIWVGFILCTIFFFTSIFIVKLDKKKDDSIFGNEKPENAENGNEKFTFRDIKKLTASYWLIIFNYLSTASVVYCFSNITSGYFQIRFGYDPMKSGNIMSAVFGVCAFLSPFIGFIVDRIGRRLILVIVSCFFIMIAHILFIVTPDSSEPIYPIFYLILIGLAYSVHSTALWSALPFTVDEKVLGTAYGSSYSLSNIGFFTVPLIIGTLQENTKTMHGYFWVGIFFILLAFTGVCTGLALLIIDKKKGGSLNSKSPHIAQPNSMNFRSKRHFIHRFRSFGNLNNHHYISAKVMHHSNSL